MNHRVSNYYERCEKKVLSRERCAEILNGSNWNGLYVFACKSLKLRKILVNEFNFKIK